MPEIGTSNLGVSRSKTIWNDHYLLIFDIFDLDQ
jgi:hypothetical protein